MRDILKKERRQGGKRSQLVLCFMSGASRSLDRGTDLEFAPFFLLCWTVMKNRKDIDAILPCCWWFTVRELLALAIVSIRNPL